MTLQNMTKRISQIFLFMSCSFMLAACSNPEKSDIQAIERVLTESKISPASQQELQQQLTKSSSEQEIKDILTATITQTETVAINLEKLEMRSEEGKEIRNLLSQGFIGTANNTQKAFKIRASDEAQMRMLEQDLLIAQNKVQQGFERFKVLAEKNGIRVFEAEK